jgi:hypothetical protein
MAARCVYLHLSRILRGFFGFWSLWEYPTRRAEGIRE